MLGEQTGLFETVRIHQRFHPVARCQFAALALLCQSVFAAAQDGFAGACAKFGDSLLHGMNGHMKSFRMLTARALRSPYASCRCTRSEEHTSELQSLRHL